MNFEKDLLVHKAYSSFIKGIFFGFGSVVFKVVFAKEDGLINV